MPASSPRRVRAHLFAFAAASLLLAAGQAAAEQSGPIRIGISQAISGANGDYFRRQVVNPAILAIEEFNAKGGVRGRKIEYVVEDNKANATTGASVARKLIDIDKVNMIFVSVTPATLATIAVAEEKKVLVMTVAEHPDITKSQWAARASTTSVQYGIAQARFAHETLKAKTAAIIREDNEAIRLQVDAFTKEFTKLGGKIVLVETYKSTDQDMRAQVAKAKDVNADVLNIPSTGQRVYGLVLKQAAELGYKPKAMIAREQVTHPEVQQLAGDLVKGVYYTGLKIDAEWNKSVFTKRFGYEADSFGAKSYDAVRIYLQALERAGTDDPEKVRDTLYAFRDYKGALGTWGFAGTGEPELFPEMRRIE
jgi:branched-chain amino acid transport system substrate-binding protein